MDMKKKDYQCPISKKVTSLKATAAAVIALNSGIVLAVTCQPVISSSIPFVYSFDSGSSVTVVNAGTV